MKHIKTFERKHTKNWYSTYINEPSLEFQFNKLLNYEIEDAKFYYNSSLRKIMILAYMEKEVHDKYFKSYFLQNKYDEIIKKLESNMVEVDPVECIEDYKLRIDSEKYNL